MSPGSGAFTVEDARRLATVQHEGQVDKAGRAYIEHPAAVATAVEDRGEHAVMAAWLHDTVEDTGLTLDALAALGCPAEVVAAVDSVSRRRGEDYLDLIRRAAADPIGRVVKLADNAHNSSEERLALLAPAVADRLRSRYAAAREILLAVRS